MKNEPKTAVGSTVDSLVLFPMLAAVGFLVGALTMACGDPIAATPETLKTVIGGMIACVSLGLSVGFWTGLSHKQNAGNERRR